MLCRIHSCKEYGALHINPPIHLNNCCVSHNLPARFDVEVMRLTYLLFKFIHVQALMLCTGRTAHRGSRGITLIFRD